MSTMPPSIYIVNAQEDTWTSLAPMPTPRREQGLAVVDGKIYAIGGYNGTGLTVLNINEEYNPATNTWTTKTPMPTPRRAFATFVYDNKIHAIGGTIDYYGSPFKTNVHEIYNPLTDTWETKDGTPLGVSGFDGNIVKDKAYLISGTNHYTHPWRNSDMNKVYDLKLDVWSEKTPIPNAVYNYASAVADDKIFVIGGYDQSIITSYDLTQIYNPVSDSWSLGSSIPVAVSGAGCVATKGDLGLRRIYVLGGYIGDYGEAKNINQIYNPEEDKWTLGVSLPSSRFLFGLADVDGELYAIGGSDGTSYLGLNQKYTPIGYGTQDPNYVTPTPDSTPPAISTPTHPPEPESESFPTTLVLTSVAIIAVVGVGIFTYYKKYKRKT